MGGCTEVCGFAIPFGGRDSSAARPSRKKEQRNHQRQRHCLDRQRPREQPLRRFEARQQPAGAQPCHHHGQAEEAITTQTAQHRVRLPNGRDHDQAQADGRGQAETEKNS